MSNKRFRNPAQGKDAAGNWSGGAEAPATSAGRADDTAEAADTADNAEQAQAGGYSQVPEKPVGLDSFADDYLENSHHGDKPVAPGVYRTTPGAGYGMTDLRTRIKALKDDDLEMRAMTDSEKEFFNDQAVRFLWQVVAITSGVLESVRVGDIRRIVAADLAMPGDVVREDGTVSRHPDAFKVSEGGSDAGSRPTPEAAPTPNPAGKPRGATHPLIVLLRMAIQSARLIKQITGGMKVSKSLGKHKNEAIEALEGMEALLGSLQT